MCKSTVMTQAHAMTKQVIRRGDNYHVTLGLCIRQVHANNARLAAIAIVNAKRIKAEKREGFWDAVFGIAIVITVMIPMGLLLIGILQSGNDMEYRHNMQAIDYAASIPDQVYFEDLQALADEFRSKHAIE